MAQVRVQPQTRGPSRYKQSFRSFGHARAVRPAPPPPPAPSEEPPLPPVLPLDLPTPEEDEEEEEEVEQDLHSLSDLPSPVREEPEPTRQVHTGPVTRKGGR